MNQLDLKGRVAVVTGGARGIGYAIARRALRSGANVTLWDVDRDALDSARQTLSADGSVGLAHVDITDRQSIEAATAATLQRNARIDILVNNAGITGGNAPVWDLEPDTWKHVMDVNLTGPFLACRAVVPQMLAAGYGRIVNIASIAGKEGNPNAAHYSASKAGLIGFTKSLAKEVAARNVVVNCVTPAVARTEILSQMTQAHIDYMLSRIPIGRFVEVEEIAALVCWLASEDCSFSTGSVFDISGGRATY